jgi:TRAP-type C4-dicarboxylate transport system substrate-binding protein
MMKMMSVPSGTTVSAAFKRIALFTFALAFAAAPSPAAAQPEAPRTIHWVLAHTRDDAAYSSLFTDFARRIEEKSAGGLKIEFVGKSSSGENLDTAAHQMVLDGAADMGQFEKDVVQYVPAVTAPFAFRSYAHAEAVFNGPVGKKLIDSLYASSDRKLRGLAFTYSGGQRVFFGKTPITKLADFSGQRMESPGNNGWSPLMDEVMKAVGVRLVPVSERNLEAADQFENVINRGPEALERLPGAAKELKYLNRTNHGLLVTTIVANEKFFSSLTEGQRRLLTDEIKRLAVKERRLSISLEPKRLEILKKMGMQVVELPAAERERFAAVGESVLKNHPEIYETIQEIRAVKEDSRTAQR